MNKDTPLHIRKLSKKWHLNTITGAYIAAANLDATLAREKLDKEYRDNKDKRIQKQRWDLDY